MDGEPKNIPQAENLPVSKPSPEITQQEPIQPTQASQIKESTPAEKISPPTPESPFAAMHVTIDTLVKQIQEGRNGEKSKRALSDLLRAREQYYRDVAMAINPEIKPVEGNDHLYRIGDTEVYGGITAMLDATPHLAEHTKIAGIFGIHSEDAKTLQGENVQPKSLLESLVVFSGSSAQDRIQPYAGDIDLSEYIKIEAKNTEEGAAILAKGIQDSIQQVNAFTLSDGSEITAHFDTMQIGSGPYDAADTKSASWWSVDEVKQGFKLYRSRITGEMHRMDLQRACDRPRYIKSNYICLTDNTVFSVSKMTDVIINNENKQQIFSSAPNEAQSLHQVYFQNPSEFDLIERAYNPDAFIRYTNTMKREIKEKSTAGSVNRMKVMKRLYNLYKANGDLNNAQELSEFFSSPSAAIYQLESRLKLAKDAVVKNNIKSGPQRDEIKKHLGSLLQNHSNPLAQEALVLLKSPHIYSVYGKFHAIIKELINSDIEQFVAEKPAIKKTIDSIRSDPSVRTRYE